MANYHAVYIDSPSSWTYAPDSYDSKLGFYTNAWLTNQTEEESETPVISCSYFYEIGKEDDVGFTPRRINYNSSSGILTVEGKQSGVPSLVSKSFRKKSPSPRFLNLRESLRKRRPARFIVSQIITDDNDSLVNIKKYLGIDEEGEEKSAEEFEAEMDIDSLDPNDVYMIDKDEIVDWFVNRERKIMKDSSKEDVLGIWADYSDPDDDEYDEVESMNKDDIIQIYLFNYRDGLEGNDEEELQNRLADELEFGAEKFDAPQATIDTQWAMNMIQSQYDNVGIDRVLSVREDFEGDLFITILLTNGNRQQLIIEKSQIGMAYDEDKGEYVRMGAEEFEADTADVDFDEAYMERQDAERIMKLLRIVKRKATGSNARYAKTYADAAEMAYYDYGFKGLKTQVAYVLSNLGGWRGDEAKQVKAELRKLMR